jgi:hypothetical protein
MIDLVDVAFLLAFGLILYLGWLGVQAREHAYALVARHCRAKGLLLLDQSVSFKAAWLKRDSNGHVRFWRSYKFEFSSTGNERYHGLIVLLGRSVESIELEPYRLPEAEEE